MPIAARAACLFLAVLQFATPALAQTAAAPPAQAPAPEQAPIVPAQAVAAPSYQLEPMSTPLSAQILQINLGPFSVSRAGIGVPDLLGAVAGSPRAVDLIREGQGQVSTGSVLALTGLIVFVGTFVAGAVVIAENPHPTSDQTALVTGLFIGSLVGIVIQFLGAGMISSGSSKLAAGVNAYNADLLDRRLAAPAR